MREYIMITYAVRVPSTLSAGINVTVCAVLELSPHAGIMVTLGAVLVPHAIYLGNDDRLLCLSALHRKSDGVIGSVRKRAKTA